MLKLIRKEFALAMHPITPMMLILSAMVMIPNYPYVVIFFYVSMAIFFTCLQGRENNDVVYSLNLPVPKSDIVKARFMFAVILELLQLLLMVPFAILSQSFNKLGNQAGMDANLSLFAVGLVVYGLFNLVFFLSYYRDVTKVGTAFVKSSILLFVCAALNAAGTHAIPFIRERLDTPDPEFLAVKLASLAVGALVYVALTLIAYRSSLKNFEKQDLN